MKSWYQKPHPQLAAYVRTMLVIEGFAEPDSNTPPILTNGMAALYFRSEHDLTNNNHEIKLTLHGTVIPDSHWIINTQTTIIAYLFKPFALASLFNVSAKSLKDSKVCLEPKLEAGNSTIEKIEALDKLIIEKLQQNGYACDIIQHATNRIMLNSGREILAELVEELNLSERTFQRMFKKYVGITPTQYRKICQFQLAFGQLKSKQFGKLTDVAFDNGFADQSHFTRTFKEFTTTTPNQYLRKGLTNKQK